VAIAGERTSLIVNLPEALHELLVLWDDLVEQYLGDGALRGADIRPTIVVSALSGLSV